MICFDRKIMRTMKIINVLYMQQINSLTLYSIITPFDIFEIHLFENIMQNRAFPPIFENILEKGAAAPLEQMLHFP